MGENLLTPRQILLAQYALPPGVNAYSVERMMLNQLHMKLLSTPPRKTGLKNRSASA
jgi:hypothetical protein